MPPASQPPAQAKILTVSQLNAQVQGLLEQTFGELWVAGEISGFKPHASGHLYFKLKDAQSVVDAVIWRSTGQRLRFTLTNGLEVIARCQVSLYPPQGRYQIYVNQLIPKGVGELELAFRQLQEKLSQRGWFDEARKKPLPLFPRRIALVTSPTGAVIRDMLRIITRRWPGVELLVCPVPVQGEGAAARIAEAIERLNQWSLADVMIVGRGGGSLEDLWAFNEEVVAAAIVASRIPVISAVGHEVDFTIADFVADRRAATPSEAAEMVVPDQREVAKHLQGRMQYLAAQWHKTLDRARQRLGELAERGVFRDPLRLMRDLNVRVDGWEERLRAAMQRRLDRASDTLQSQSSRLDGLNPLNVLARGYSLCRKVGEEGLLRDAKDVNVGELLRTRLLRGELVSRVESIEPEQAKHGGARPDPSEF